jgi:hypothetical protein
MKLFYWDGGSVWLKAFFEIRSQVNSSQTAKVNMNTGIIVVLNDISKQFQMIIFNDYHSLHFSKSLALFPTYHSFTAFENFKLRVLRTSKPQCYRQWLYIAPLCITLRIKTWVVTQNEILSKNCLIVSHIYAM